MDDKHESIASTVTTDHRSEAILPTSTHGGLSGAPSVTEQRSQFPTIGPIASPYNQRWETGRKPMARKKVSTTVYIEPEQAERLKLLHERTKVPIAVYIREGIELALAKYEHLLPGQLPLDVDATKRTGG